MRPLYAVLAAAVALAPIAAALTPVAAASTLSAEPVETISERPDRVAVVVYRDEVVSTSALRGPPRYGTPPGLGLIIQTRTIDVPAGEGVIRFKGLGTGIIAHSAVVSGLPAHLIEQNADYELITPGALLRDSVGQTVSVVRTNASNGQEETQSAVIRAGENGTVLEIDGRFEALDCSGLTERIVFNQIPEGLGATPTLSVRTRASEAGRHTITLAYLAADLFWSADYVAHLASDGRTLDLQGWITLQNKGGTSFENAPVVVVAGQLERNPDTVPQRINRSYFYSDCWPQGRSDEGLYVASRENRVEYHGPPQVVAAAPVMRMREALEVEDIVVTGSRIRARLEELGDYKAYVLPEATTVAAMQMKQVLFLAQDGVSYRRVHVADFYDADTDDAASETEIELRIVNDEASGLGLPVPQGNLVMMEGEDGQIDYAAEATVRDTPSGLPIRVIYASDPEVTSRVVLTEEKSRWWGRFRKAVETRQITLTNSSDQSVTVEMPFGAAENNTEGFRIEHEDIASRIDPETGRRVWTVELAAGENRTFKVRNSYSDPE